MKKLTDEEINVALKDATASVEMEGLETHKEMDEIIKKRLKKEISESEAIRLIKEFAIKSGEKNE